MKLFLSLLLLVGTTKSMFACDVCGCSMSGFGMGVLPNQNAQFVGLRYNYSSFSSKVYHSSSSSFYDFSHDAYHKFDLIGRISLAPKLKLNLVLPLLYNVMSDSASVLTSAGIGDPNIVVYFQPFKEHEKWKSQTLFLGGGIKLPFGKYKQQTNEKLINPNFQLGTGSVDFITTANYTYRKNKIGFQIESSYKFNTKNKNDYRFGNQFNVSSNLFYFKETKKITSLFFLGGYFESGARHTENSTHVSNTGATILYANAGIQFYVKRMRLGFLWQQPLAENFHTDNLTVISADPRFSIDLIYSFGKIKTN